MGAKKISVVDLSQEEEQVKTSRKRAKNLTALRESTSKKEKTKTAKTPKERVVAIEKPTNEVEASEVEIVEKPTEKKAKKSSKDRKKSTRSKRYTDMLAKVDSTKLYSIQEAAALAKETANTKFTGSVELHMKLNQKGLRGTVSLPHGTGNKKTVLVFGNVKESDNVIIGNDDTIAKIEANRLAPGKDFQVVIATPQYMPKIAKIAKILGPKGLMPNPKSGTVTDSPDKVVANLVGGQIEYKTEQNAPLMHLGIGKTSFEEKLIQENLTTILNAVGQNKILQASINSTMGPSIKLEVR